MTGDPLSVEVQERESEIAPQIKTSTSVEEEEMDNKWATAWRKRRKRQNARTVKNDLYPIPIQLSPTPILLPTTLCRHPLSSRPTEKQIQTHKIPKFLHPHLRKICDVVSWR